MTARRDSAVESRHPRETHCFFGHHYAEAALLDSYRGGRMPHAWLIGGPPGIGKATLAYRMARFVLAHPDPASATVQRAESLAIDPQHAASRAVTLGTHGGLLALERLPAEKGGLRANIAVDQVRETVPFFGATSAAGGWRVCIVDAVDELKWPEAPNALLKILEEPPPNALFLLVSHAPARVLATIRSRCRILLLREMENADVVAAASDATGLRPDDPALLDAANAADGSVARALMLLGGGARELQDKVGAALSRLPEIDWNLVHAVGDALHPGDKAGLAVFADQIGRWLSHELEKGLRGASHARAVRITKIWDHLNEGAREIEALNLDRKALIFSIFEQLAGVAGEGAFGAPST
jgi:DNA polymerase-3 subunit delta'